MEREPLHVEMRQAREAKGISLSDIHESTRIRIEMLEALERGQYDVLPTPYVRLFLRTYAEKVGLDPRYVLERYEETKPEEVKPLTEMPQKAEIETAQKPPIEMPWRYIGAVATGAVVIAVIFALMMGRSEREPASQANGPERPIVERPARVPSIDTTETVSPSFLSPAPEDTASPALSSAVEDVSIATSEEPPAAAPLGPEIAEPGSLLTLIARSQEPTWVGIYGDRKMLFQGTLAAGEERTWTARDTFFVISGKPLGTQFVFQGTTVPQDKLPKEGILRLRLSRAGVKIIKPR